MATYLFSDIVSGIDTITTFDPTLDVLNLQATATEVQVKFGTGNIIFTTAAGSVTLPIWGDQIVNGATSGDNIIVTAGNLIIGDNTTDMGADSLDDHIHGHAVEGSQYFGRTGADSFMGGTGADLVYGNKGGDVLWGGGGADTLYGGQGDDMILGWDAAGTTLDGGQVVDPAYVNMVNGIATTPAFAGDQLIYGNLDGDTMISGDGADVHYGGQGNDVIYSFGGVDVVYGNKGNDYIAGGDGDDWLYGGQGDDSIDFGNGTELVYGNLNDDSIFGGTGSATIYGGQGDDIIHAPTMDFEYLTVSNPPSNVVYGNKGHDSIIGGSLTADSINNGNRLSGGPGDDTIVSGVMAGDHMFGGTGSDVFAWLEAEAINNKLLGSDNESEQIYDYETGVDSLVFAVDQLFASTPGSFNPVYFFTGSTTGTKTMLPQTVNPGTDINAGVKLGACLISQLGGTGWKTQLLQYKTNGATPTLYVFAGVSSNASANPSTPNNYMRILKAQNTTGGATIDAVSTIYAVFFHRPRGSTFQTTTPTLTSSSWDIILF